MESKKEISKPAGPLPSIGPGIRNGPAKSILGTPRESLFLFQKYRKTGEGYNINTRSTYYCKIME